MTLPPARTLPVPAQPSRPAGRPPRADRLTHGPGWVAVFPAATSSIPAVRSWTCRHLTDLGHDEASTVVALLVTEVATNAVRHTTTARLAVRLDLTHYGVRVAVHDDEPGTTPQIRQADHWDYSGRGLAMVETLSDAWGTHVTTDGKWVWFTVQSHRYPDA